MLCAEVAPYVGDFVVVRCIFGNIKIGVVVSVVREGILVFNVWRVDGENGDRLEVNVGKCLVADLANRFRDGNRLQRRAAHEGLGTDLIKILRHGNRSQRRAILISAAAD